MLCPWMRNPQPLSIRPSMGPRMCVMPFCCSQFSAVVNSALAVVVLLMVSKKPKNPVFCCL